MPIRWQLTLWAAAAVCWPALGLVELLSGELAPALIYFVAAAGSGFILWDTWRDDRHQRTAGPPQRG